MKNTGEQPIGQMVVSDYRIAAVFKKHGIDFCCNGNRTIEVACTGNTKLTEQIKKEIRDLQEITDQYKNSKPDFQSWPIDLLADYIEKKHHRYVTKQIPVISEYLIKLCKVHGAKHPELLEINSLFNHCVKELSVHMRKEELLLFPFIRKMVTEKKETGAAFSTPFDTIQSPIHMMMEEHQVEGERFRKINVLSQNYTMPQDGCNTYWVGYELLREFENDLHLHIHLENNILFPKAIELELAKNS